jgi:hypothetical protein
MAMDANVPEHGWVDSCCQMLREAKDKVVGFVDGIGTGLSTLFTTVGKEINGGDFWKHVFVAAAGITFVTALLGGFGFTGIIVTLCLAGYIIHSNLSDESGENA